VLNDKFLTNSSKKITLEGDKKTDTNKKLLRRTRYEKSIVQYSFKLTTYLCRVPATLRTWAGAERRRLMPRLHMQIW